MEQGTFLRFLIALSGALIAVGTGARADVATIGASKDNTIFQSNVNNSLGAGQAIFAGTNAQSSPRRGLIQFDIAGSVPAGSTINSVQLTLFLNQVGSAATSSPTIRLYRLANEWGEGTAGNSTNGVSGIGQGFAAGEGDATWNARHFSPTTPTLWRTGCGDAENSTPKRTAAHAGCSLKDYQGQRITCASVGRSVPSPPSPAGRAKRARGPRSG